MIKFTYTNPKYTCDSMTEDPVEIEYTIQSTEATRDSVLYHFECFLKSIGYHIPPGSRVDVVGD
jgi:hypothetical protein